MTRSEVIKFRVSPRLKAALESAAEGSSRSVSDLLRNVAAHVIEGRAPDAAIRADMLAVRLAANAVLSWAEASGLSQDEVRDLIEAGQRLRDVAARHLRPMP